MNEKKERTPATPATAPAWRRRPAVAALQRTRPSVGRIDLGDAPFEVGGEVAAIPVLQSDFGVKPYSLMLGQLKVADEVIVEIDAEIPA